MPESVTTFLGSMAEAVLSGPIEAMVARHVFPYPMQVEARLLMMWTPDELLAFLRQRRAILAGRGVLRVEAEVAGIEVPRGGRFRAWARWLHRYPGDSVEDESAGILFLRRGEDGLLRVEMSHFLRMSTLRQEKARAVGQ